MFNAIISADWHIGAIDPRQFQKQVTETIVNKMIDLMNKEQTLDAVIIAGDLFDSKQYFASEAVAVAVEVLSDIMYYAGILEAQVYLIDGTRTHDAGQLKYLVNFFDALNLDDTFPIHLISTATGMTMYSKINEPVKVLFLPEEYVSDQEAYYQSFFHEQYDIIIGHGMIDKIWYAKKEKDENTNKILYAPVFELDQLLEVGNYTFFGHVHTHKLYKGGRFRYLGPVTRWEFGSTTEVGVTYIEYDEYNHCMNADEFIENKNAPLLPTRILNLVGEEYEIDMVNTMIDDILAEELARGASKIRFIVNINSKLENSLAMKNFITTKIGDIPIAKLIISSDFDKEVVDNMKESMEVEKKTLSYVFDRNLDIEERIKQFIATKSGKELTIEKIKEYLENE